MVLFHCWHLMGLSTILALRLTKHRGEDAVLMVNEEFAQSRYARNLVDEGVFSKIVSFQIDLAVHEESEEEIYRKILDYFQTCLHQNQVDLDEMQSIYCGFDTQNPFGIFLSLKKIRHMVFELYENQLSDSLRNYQILFQYHNASAAFSDAQKKHFVLCGGSDLVVKKLLSTARNLLAYDCSSVEYCNFMNLLFSINSEDKAKLCRSFELQKQDFSQATLVLFNSVGYSLPKMNVPYGQFYQLYQLIIDYYVDSKSILIKNHPQTVGQLEEYFTDVTMLDRLIPIELFGLMEGFRLKKTIGCNTAAAAKIEQYVEQSICLGDSVFHHYKLLHKLYAAGCIEQILCDDAACFHYCDISLELLEKVKEHMFGKATPFKGINRRILKGNIFAYIDKVENKYRNDIVFALQNADIDTKVVFLNSNRHCIFYAPNSPYSPQSAPLLEYIVPITIKKTCLKEGVLDDMQEETIYLFCKNPAVREKVKQFTMLKLLKQTGIAIEVSPITEEELTIERLKIRVEAAEAEGCEQRKKLEKLEEQYQKLVASQGDSYHFTS